ncbi:DUF3987 domain-containing protein [Pseudogemmobacter bohemicus]|uniref:DUF3987 domain-containing protein n=1 Tax=Pseudogemmobacter bohemicus TaxID=2250708 RepID=UPI000DD34CBE|nr:DUF3987 domain-containing protein [Pseudogemmobacter bohemicus]
MNAQTKPALSFASGFGQSDTHVPTLSDGRPNPAKLAGQPYNTVDGQQILAMVKNPPSVPKDKARWFIPSTYHGSDARAHEAQRLNGQFFWATIDVDQNNLALSDILDTVHAVLPDARCMIYSSRSSTEDNKKWRALIPLKGFIPGADYSDTMMAFYDLLEAASAGTLIPDRALARPGQLIYLPNKGEFYEFRLHAGRAAVMDPDNPVVIRREENRAQIRAAQEFARKERERRPSNAPAGSDTKPVDHFNQAHTIADLFTRYGYQQAGRSRDWRSPMQTSGSYATKDFGEYWVSLSSSDAAAGVGRATPDGHRYGDAFDLYVHHEKSGDFVTAVREYAEEARLTNTRPADRRDDRAAPGDNPGRRDAEPVWGAPDPRYLRTILPEAPTLPLEQVFPPAWCSWIRTAAESKGAPADYVVAALLSVTGALLGNTRWVAPWEGWSEPPILWSMAIGNPSAGKSPGLDAVMAALKVVEREGRQEVEGRLTAWRAAAEVAKLAESAWKEAVKAAIRDGDDIPQKPAEADPGPEPIMPRYALADATTEKLAVIVAGQPRGTLVFRDELSGWLGNMSRYSGGSDRPFWLEAYGGKGYSVERMGRDPVWINRLTIGVTGGIQPDKLKTLLMKTDDDGLLARFLPIWPNPAPIKRPEHVPDAAFIESALRRLVGLSMVADEDGELRPWFIPFMEPTRDHLNDFRLVCRDWEAQHEGLLLSFIGKLPGMAVRLSLIFAVLDWLAGAPEVTEISPNHFGRAAGFIEAYLLPMAIRSYADGSIAKEDRAGRKLAALIIEQGWEAFSTTDVLRLDRSGIATKAELDPALDALAVGDLIRLVPTPGAPKGGRPSRRFVVNPALHEKP